MGSDRKLCVFSSKEIQRKREQTEVLKEEVQTNLFKNVDWIIKLTKGEQYFWKNEVNQMD